MRDIVRFLGQALLQHAARAYIAGLTLEDALQVCRSLASRGFGSTMCFWDSETDSPGHVTERYGAIIEAIHEEALDCYLSVKAPSLGFSRRLFRGLARRASEWDIGLHFDSLGPETVDPTFVLIRDLLPQDARMGCTLPGRWRRSPADVDQAVDIGLRVRIVKGQWDEPEAPPIDARTGFLDVVDRVAGRVSHASIATHDPPLAREALLRLRAAKTPCDLELLFGLPVQQLIPIANELGVPVRCYVPYGSAYLPYSMWQARRLPQVVWWFVRDLFRAVGRPDTNSGSSSPTGWELLAPK